MPLHEIFNDKTIPEAFQIQKLICQDTYLINGELRPWKGRMVEIYSPVLVPTEKGGFEKKLLGKVPELGEKEALEALESAKKA
ncbi:MAG: NADP-dependent glyceraldehyde-3-phosphate dehydrogenase, partial [Flavobacteriaceae bacterium]|nr:NADP-dependent glyceraldehyde-3-phosphate dehydrogenase [Flavobacteriaceae bacterium]